jgi:hypothetical protein
MKKITCTLSATCAVVAIALGPATAQTARIESGVRSLAGVDFYWETRLVPPVPPLDDFGMLTFQSGPNVRRNDSDTVHRVMIDRSRKVYFGYDAHVAVVKTESPTVYRITFGPLSSTPQLQQALGADVQSWKLLPAPRFPAPREVRSGEVLELILLTNSAWGQQLSEYVTLQEPRRQGFDSEPPREFAFAGGPPRDFTTGDAALRLEEPRVTTTYPRADTPQSLSLGWTTRDRSGITAAFTTRGNAEGPIIWLYLPGRGRFLLSLTPRTGFQRVGEVRGSSLRFTADGQTYDVWSSSQIAPATAAFNLYVLRQPDWKPTYENANLDTIHVGAADRLEYLVGRQ